MLSLPRERTSWSKFEVALCLPAHTGDSGGGDRDNDGDGAPQLSESHNSVSTARLGSMPCSFNQCKKALIILEASDKGTRYVSLHRGDICGVAFNTATGS